MTASYTMLGFAIFGGICFTFIVVLLAIWLIYYIYTNYNYKIFRPAKYRQACDDWEELQSRFLKKYSFGKYPAISLKFQLPFPSCKNVNVISQENGRLYFNKMDGYEFCLFVDKIKYLQEKLNILQL